jgi:hypothetical protein
MRYRALKKNAHGVFVTCALVNLFVSRKKLLAALASEGMLRKITACSLFSLAAQLSSTIAFSLSSAE